MRQAGTIRRRRTIRVAALGGVAAILTALTFAAPAAAEQPLTDHSVRVDVLSVSPTTPVADATKRPLTVRLRITNNTDQSIDKIVVQGVRGNPISTQQALDAAIAKPQPPDPSLAAHFDATAPVSTSLGPRASTTVTYASTSDTLQDAGLCICQNRIYPLYFTVHAVDQNGADLIIGSTQTYLPAFGEFRPAPVQVSWIWPIIDRPHRLVGETVFTDDELAFSVNGGRLDRILDVVEQAGSTVPMTLVIDPELIDELAVMSGGTYQVDAGGKVTAGTGGPAARSWLERLRAALAANPNLEVDFTPFADPDVESLTRNGLSWTNGMNQQAQARVSEALGGRLPSSEVVWPADEALSEDTLNAVVRQGAKSVILSDAALPGGADASPALNQLATLQTPAGPVSAIVTAKTIQRYVAPVLSVGGPGLARLPELVAEVAVRAGQEGDASHYVAIVAPRTLDPSPDIASRAIRDTARTYWSTGLSLNAATDGTVPPADHGQLVPPNPNHATLSPLTINAAQNVSRIVPALSSMLSAADATQLLGSLPAAVQRAESSAWRTDSAAGDEFAAALSRRIDGIESGVRIVKPSTGTYTLASSNSPLPVTIHNDLAVAVTVRVKVTSANGLPGFDAHDPGNVSIPAGQNVTLHIPTHVERTGRFLVQAVLLTPSDVELGSPVSLSVHSTALGTIGVIITVVAGGVLVLALMVRFARRWRGRPNEPQATEPVIHPVAVP